MLGSRFVAWVFSVGIVILGAGGVFGQIYPSKPIRIVTTGPGSNTDFTLRLIAQGIYGPLGQPVVVDNRSSGVIPGEVVAKAPPDGYTLLYYGNTLWVAPITIKSYDPVRDLSPISLVSRAPQVLVVHPSLPVKSVKELIALAKVKPGELNYASGATGGAVYLQGELFNSMAGVNIVSIPYRTGSQEGADLISGHVQVAIRSGPESVPHIKAGRLRALAVGSAKPSPLFPELPTIAASGVPGYEAVQINGMLAPAGTAVAIVNRLNQEVVRVVNSADVKEKFLNAGIEAVGSSPEEFAAFIKADMARMVKLIKDANLRRN